MLRERYKGAVRMKKRKDKRKKRDRRQVKMKNKRR